MNLINSPIWNKGTSFTPEERDAFALEGLLPPYVETLEEQVAKAYGGLRPETSDLDKHIYLRSLQDTNEVLFYRLLLDHSDELLPLIYRPTMAEACGRFSDIYRRPRGLFVSYPLRDRIPELLRSRPYAEVDVIVVTDGEQVFGLGDAGVAGLSVPIGKLSLYTLFGGIHPSRTLPIVLDVGTNSPQLLNDPAYPGWRHERITGQEYSDFVDQFVEAVKEELPGTCLQWEDFAAGNAQTILKRYQNEMPTFNDNLQGTAAVVTGALLAAFNAAGNVLRNGQVVLVGAGPECLTTADYLRREMENEGLASAEARKRIWLVDERDLSAVMRSVRPSALVGFSNSDAAFTESTIREMAAHTKRPIILTLSSSGDNDQPNPQDIIRWTEGRALIASGSQLSSIHIFPAVGLGLAASRAARVTDGMMLAAARALAERSPALQTPHAPLLPEIPELREVVIDVATAMACEAQREGLAPRLPEEELRQEIEETQWCPEYPALVHAVAV